MRNRHYIVIATDAGTKKTVYLNGANSWSDHRWLAARLPYAEARRELASADNSLGVFDTAIVPE